MAVGSRQAVAFLLPAESRAVCLKKRGYYRGIVVFQHAAVASSHKREGEAWQPYKSIWRREYMESMVREREKR